MKFITVATKNEGYFPYLIESAKVNNCDLVVLGFGEKWQGFTWKFKLMIDYIKNLDPNEIICFIDAYDVIFLQPSYIIEERFKEITLNNNGIVISEDINVNLISSILWTKCKNTYINSGTYMGYVNKILPLLENICKIYNCDNKNSDDQLFIQNYCNNNPKLFNIDTNKFIFLVSIINKNLDVNNISFYNNELYYNKEVKPCILHAVFNSDIENILYNLGYNYIPINKNNNYFLSRVFYTIKTRKIFTIIIFIFILIIIIIIIYLILKKSSKKLNKRK